VSLYKEVMAGMDPSLFRKGTGEAGRQFSRFVLGSPISRRAEWLTQVGVAGVEELNGAHIQRLTLGGGITEVQAALEQVRKVAEETGLTPEVRAIDLAKLARLARVGRMKPHSRNLAGRLDTERTKLYEKIAHSAGPLAVGESI
jgi:hypothetical protein